MKKEDLNFNTTWYNNLKKPPRERDGFYEALSYKLMDALIAKQEGTKLNLTEEEDRLVTIHVSELLNLFKNYVGKLEEVFDLRVIEVDNMLYLVDNRNFVYFDLDNTHKYWTTDIPQWFFHRVAE